VVPPQENNTRKREFRKFTESGKKTEMRLKAKNNNNKNKTGSEWEK